MNLPPPGALTINYTSSPYDDSVGRLSITTMTESDLALYGLREDRAIKERRSDNTVDFRTPGIVTLTRDTGLGAVYFSDTSVLESTAYVYVYPHDAGTHVQLIYHNFTPLSLEFTCAPVETDTIDVPICAALLYLDSGKIDIGTSMSSIPREFKVPTMLRVTGDLLLNVKTAGDQLRFELSGLTSDLRYAGRPLNPKLMGTYGVELIPSYLESHRDMLVALAGIIFGLGQFFQIALGLWRKHRTGQPGGRE